MGTPGERVTPEENATGATGPGITLPNEMGACLQALEQMAEELQDALLASDVDRVQELTKRQDEWAEVVSAKWRDGSFSDADRTEAIRLAAERVSGTMALNKQLMEDGLSMARFAFGAMTGADESAGMYSPDGTIRGHEGSGGEGSGSPSSRLVRRTV